MAKTNFASASGIISWMIALAVAYLFACIFVPVAKAVAAAAILAIAVYPFHERIRRLVPVNSTCAAFATTIIVCLLIGGPLAAATWFITREAAHAYMSARELLAGQPAGLTSWPMLASISDLAGISELDLRKFLLDNLDAIGIPATRAAGAFLRNVGTMIAGLFVFLAMLVLFLRDGAALVKTLERLLPLSASRKAALLAKLSSAAAAAVQGVFLIALVQGALAVLGFALFGIRFAALLGALCAVLSPIPFIGSALIWVPVVARTALEGHLRGAVLLGAWFVVIVGLSDNVARPFLLRAKMKVPLPLIIVGVFGGIGAFGISGVFFGPIIAAVALAVVDAFTVSGDSAVSEAKD